MALSPDSEMTAGATLNVEEVRCERHVYLLCTCLHFRHASPGSERRESLVLSLAALAFVQPDG
jgi:hypothetical protein